MNQFKNILHFELKYYLKNKVFVGVTVFLVLLIAAVMFFPRISAAVQSDKQPDTVKDLPVMLIKLEEGEQGQTTMQEAFSAAFPGYDVQGTNADTQDIADQIIAGDAKCAFIITSPTSCSYYTQSLSMYDSNTATAETVLKKLYWIHAMIDGGIPAQTAEETINVEIHSDVVNLGKDQLQNYFYTYIMIFALYMVMVLYGQMVATNVAAEKSSRAMEVLITSARPTSMMFGKVVASCAAGLLQLVAVFGSAFLFYNINQSYWEDNAIVQSIFNIPADLLLYMLIFFVLGFFLYAFLYGAIGSTASKVEDINTSVMPLTFFLIIGFVVAVASISSGNVDNTVVTVCSYIPFTSPIAMFARIAMSSTVAWYEIAVSIGILMGSVWGIGLLSAKIYRVGVLMYGTTPKIRAVLKAVWKA
ncbi:MAG: ABC transporter permease [Clostridiales bacterium]|jgi:ABC-2 type transport system permease protein|nr:ABC transporter permease [Clostridiales bacterium]